MHQEVVRVQDLLESLSYENLLRALCDTRSLHSQLFSDAMNSRGAFSGIYRGQAGSKIDYYDFGSNSVLAKSFLEPARNVEREIKKLSRVIMGLSVRDKPEEFYRRVIFIYWRFITIHPFVDGNGHIGRLILFSLLERHPDICLRRGWEVSPTPFSSSISDCIRLYKVKPDILEGYLRNWFSVGYP